MAMKLVLCGTNYGASYIPAIESEGSGFELVGILAKGSERSTKLAAAKGVPLWSSADEVDPAVRVAVVALPPSAAVAVTKALMKRGIHVLLEHPVEGDALADIRRGAQSAGVTVDVNCHFADLRAPRAFIDDCRRRSRLGKVHYASVVTAPRSAYTTFDVLGRALGGLNDAWLESETTSASSGAGGHPFQSFRGRVAGIPTRVQCTSAVGHVDDMSDSPVPLRIEIGFEDGNLMLLGPVGPVIWSEWLRLALRSSPAPLWSTLEGESPTFAGLIEDRIDANRRALDELRRRIDGGAEPTHQSIAWLTTVASLMKIVRASEREAEK
jgi:thiazolinyl imide reductase